MGWKDKVDFVLLLIASLNIFVGMFNLLPLLPMDGGHMAVVHLGDGSGPGSPGCCAGPTRAWSTTVSCIPVSFGVFVVLVVFGPLLIPADIVNPVTLGNDG